MWSGEALERLATLVRAYQAAGEAGKIADEQRGEARAAILEMFQEAHEQEALVAGQRVRFEPQVRTSIPVALAQQLVPVFHCPGCSGRAAEGPCYGGRDLYQQLKQENGFVLLRIGS